MKDTPDTRSDTEQARHSQGMSTDDSVFPSLAQLCAGTRTLPACSSSPVSSSQGCHLWQAVNLKEMRRYNREGRSRGCRKEKAPRPYTSTRSGEGLGFWEQGVVLGVGELGLRAEGREGRGSTWALLPRRGEGKGSQPTERGGQETPSGHRHDRACCSLRRHRSTLCAEGCSEPTGDTFYKANRVSVTPNKTLCTK